MKGSKIMKKLLTLLTVALLATVAMTGCADTKTDNKDVNDVKKDVQNEEQQNNDDNKADADDIVVMSYDEYVATEIDSPVTIEAYVQGKQSWWDNKATLYTQDENGAYFVYDAQCSEDTYNLLETGTKIRISGYKITWEGEVEISDATIEVIDNADTFVATPFDATELLGKDELIDYQNRLVSFKGMTVEDISFKNDGGDDIYVTLSKDGQTYDFCVEYYLTDTETEVYKTVSALEKGTVIDVTGFLYWYQGVNTHITSVEIAE